MVRQDSKHWEYSSKEDQASAQILQEHQTLSQGTSEVAKQWAGGLWGQFDELWLSSRSNHAHHYVGNTENPFCLEHPFPSAPWFLPHVST